MTEAALKIEPPSEPAQTILIIDDEEAICRTLTDVLHDEGYQVVVAGDGESGLQLLDRMSLALVLLDIWMPGMDGIETLTRIKARHPNLPVLMISGHAAISTAVTAAKLGAADFIEKPLDLNLTLHAIRSAIEQRTTSVINPRNVGSPSESDAGFEIASTKSHPLLRPIVFESQALRGRKMQQRTLARSAVLYGQGLHSGKKSGLILEPLPANSGIHFVGMSEQRAVPAHVDFVDSTGYATTIKLGRTQAGTIEHLMSALHAYGIANLLIKCNGEVPVMDGSAKDFCLLFDEVGTVDQDGDWYTLRADKPLEVRKGEEFIRYEPGDEFRIDYTLRYPAPIGDQHFTFVLNDVETYKSEVSSARTFGFVKDIGYLQKQGLALGGRFDNFLLIGDRGVINDTLRYPDEPVRHKVLDMIGDLYLLGRGISGTVTACMTGHSENIALLKLFREEMIAATAS